MMEKNFWKKISFFVTTLRRNENNDSNSHRQRFCCFVCHFPRARRWQKIDLPFRFCHRFASTPFTHSRHNELNMTFVRFVFVSFSIVALPTSAFYRSQEDYEEMHRQWRCRLSFNKIFDDNIESTYTCSNGSCHIWRQLSHVLSLLF